MKLILGVFELPNKIVGKTNIEEEANKSENPAVSNLLMSGWKKVKEENGTNM